MQNLNTELAALPVEVAELVHALVEDGTPIADAMQQAPRMACELVEGFARAWDQASLDQHTALLLYADEWDTAAWGMGNPAAWPDA
jgi:hypothetical protein